MSTIVSTFTAHYTYKWISYFPDTPLEPNFLPTFDGRAVQYPSIKNLRDYMSWRQVDCKAQFYCLENHIVAKRTNRRKGHINNLYNTTFWSMVLKGGMRNQDAEQELKVKYTDYSLNLLFNLYGSEFLMLNVHQQGTVSSDKNEILFSRYGINYNNEPEIFKKGSVLFRDVSSKSLGKTISTTCMSNVADVVSVGTS